MKKTMTRIAACSLAVLIAFNSALVPRSKAVGAEVVGTAALATSTLAAYMTATGVPLTVTAGGAAAASAGAASLVSGYAAATGATYEVVTTAIAAGATISGGTIILGAAAVAVLAGIVAWAINEYDLLGDDGTPTTGQEVTHSHLATADGMKIVVAPYSHKCSTVNEWNNAGYTIFDVEETYELASGYRLEFGTYNNANWTWELYDGDSLVRSWAIGPIEAKWVGMHLAYGSTSGRYDFISFGSDGASINSVSSYTDSELFNDSTSIKTKVEALPDYVLLNDFSTDSQLRIKTGVNTELAPEAVPDAIFESIAGNEFAPTYVEEPVTDTAPDTGGDVGEGDETNPDASTDTGLLRRIAIACEALADKILGGIDSLFAPDPELIQEITSTFTEKFGFVETLHQLGTDLLSIDADSEPPVVWIHLEDAEGTIDYGGTVKALDMSWYERYKEDGDRIIGGFLWLGFLWALFMRVSDIINGAGMAYVLGQPTIYTPEPPNDAPRLEGSRKRGKR